MNWRIVCLLSVTLLGCNRRQQCAEAFEPIRQDIRAGDWQKAKQALTPELSAKCSGDPALSALQAELATATSRATKPAPAAHPKRGASDDLAQRSQRALTAMVQYLKWTANELGAPDKVGNEKTCQPSTKGKANVCESRLIAGGGLRTVRWLEKDKTAFVFESEAFGTGLEVKCADLQAQAVRHWLGKNASVQSHCKLDKTHDPRLQGMNLWIKNPANMRSFLSVFSDAYLKNAPDDFKSKLETEGKSL